MLKKIILILFSFILVISLFTGCSNAEKEDSTKSLAICVQNTANTAQPMLGDSEVSNTVYETVYSSGSVTIIEVDGNAHTVDKIDAKLPDNVSKSKRASLSKEITKNVLSVANSAAPKTGEVDTLKGLIRAARDLDASCDEKTVLYLGSALQTNGYLPFASQNLFDTDIEVIISQLKSKNAIPEFPANTRVVFAGLGDTAAPQKDLSYEQIARLKEIMASICKEGGATVEFITATPVSNNDVSRFPAVSTVTVYDDYVEGTVAETVSGPIKLDSTQVSFEPDSYVLSNKQATMKVLAPYVNAINSSTEKIYVCGTTATFGTDEGCKAFSLKRAQTIVNLLCEMGVESSRLVAKGLGYNNNFHVLDTDENGRLIEEAAQKNRLVLLIPMSCDDASKI